IDVTYWDYHLRVDFRGLSLQALGSYDSISIEGGLVNGNVAGLSVRSTRLSFHRLQLRYRARSRGVAVEAAAVAGMDEQATFDGRGVRKLAIGFRANVTAGWTRLRFRAGVEGELSSFEPVNILGDLPATTRRETPPLDPASTPLPLEIGEL